MTATENDNITMQPDPEDTTTLSNDWVDEDDDTDESEFDEEIELAKDDDEELEAEEE